MIESILTVSFVGLLAGFIFSMPVAGPISILVTTNALKGRVRYCNKVTIGASSVTLAYVFIAVFGLSKLYLYYKPVIPYLLAIGSVSLIFIGYKIFRTKFDIEHFEENSQIKERIHLQGKGGFYTGLIINLLNPTLFIGWLTTTFLVISFVTSLGFNMGGLDTMVDWGVSEISSLEPKAPGDTKLVFSGNFGSEHVENNAVNDTGIGGPSTYFHLMASLFYAIFIAAGSITWFYILAILLDRFRNHVNIRLLSTVIQGMGIVLCLFGIYFGWLAASMILSPGS
ncbi:MAG: hypothetical protein E4G95_04760 [Bacteroidia bacterium]|nr:MAG: hypothetical protein E4G95_04760 [Bacteroidia bacterium]